MRYVQICERCGRVFLRDETECPKCHLKTNSVQPLPSQDMDEVMINDFIKVSKWGNYHVCTLCNLAFSKELDYCPNCEPQKYETSIMKKYIKVSKSGKYHVCTRCNLAFSKELDYCPRCDHFEEYDEYDDLTKNATDNYISEGTEQSYTACDICPHPYCNDGGWCPLLD